jgi:hypothetical protein
MGLGSFIAAHKQNVIVSDEKVRNGKKCECLNGSVTHADLLFYFKGIGRYEFVVL